MVEQAFRELPGEADDAFARLAVGREFPDAQPGLEAAVDDRGQQVVLVLEVPVDGTGGESALLADEPDAGALVTAFRGNLVGGVQDPLTGLLAVGSFATGLGCFGPLRSRLLTL